MSRRWLALAVSAIALPWPAVATPTIPADVLTPSTTPIVVPIQVAGAMNLGSFTFDLSYDANSRRLLGVNGLWHDPNVTPAGSGVVAFVDFVGPGGKRATPLTGSPTSSSTVDEPLVPVLLAVGAVAFLFEQRRVRARSVPANRQTLSTASGPLR